MKFKWCVVLVCLRNVRQIYRFRLKRNCAHALSTPLNAPVLYILGYSYSWKKNFINFMYTLFLCILEEILSIMCD